MNPQFSQPGGSVSKDVNKQSIARTLGIKTSEVAYLKVGVSIAGVKTLFDSSSQLAFRNVNSTGNVVSWSVQNNVLTLVTTTGNFTLYLSRIWDRQVIQFEDFGGFTSSVVDQTPFINLASECARSTGLEIFCRGSYYVTGVVNLSGVKAGGFTLLGPTTSTSQQILLTQSSQLSHFTLDKVYIRHTGGDIELTDFLIKNTRSTAAVISTNLTALGDLSIKRGAFTGCYYGILRQGDPDTSAALRSVYLQNLRFTDMQADCIELNLGINDINTVIDNIYIDTVNHTGTNAFWGIAIGIAGKGNYTLTDNPSLLYKNLSISNCYIYKARQCLHLEKCSGAHIRNIEMYPDSSMSPNTGLDTAGLVIYGSMNTVISGITGNPLTDDAKMIWQTWGVVSGGYISAGRNLSISEVNIKGTIQLEMSATNTFLASLKLNNVTATTISLYGHMSFLGLTNVESEFLNIDIHRILGNGKDNTRRLNKCVASFNRVKCFNMNLNANGLMLGNIAFDQLEVTDCNFQIEKTTNTSTVLRGTPITKVDQTFYYNGTGFPIGYPFKKGDKIVDTNGVIYTVTSPGAKFKTTTATTAIAALAVGDSRVFANGSENWVSTFPKTAGVAVTIPGAGVGGADLQTRIIRSGFVSGGVYCFDIEDTVSTATSAGVLIYPTNECTFITNGVS
ncbi:colanic acid degradation [Klebsiella phage vB_KpnM_KpS110]|uniref:Tail fiber protein n=1 Tax=Klebsiella phage vB_KpnM_KpS110 TaxID=2079262 RepID=A0A2K9VAJ0_9CAUD|nr:colanic acid degradation [Klebsiella phage vB_KpnM_KpS110]AUV59232.1 tail fiber protein [Klebsiella phage vB_KpnM_KpS110]